MATTPGPPGVPPPLPPGGSASGPSDGSPPPDGSPPKSRRGRRTMIVGTVITIAAVILGVTSTVIVTMSVGRPLYETLTTPSKSTPLDEEFTLEAGRYTVFQLTEPETTPDPATPGINAPSITAEDVKVTGPDGETVKTSDFGSGSESVTRDEGIYSAVAQFTTPEAGDYRVLVTAPGTTQIVIAPAVSSGFRDALVWLIAGAASLVAFLFGAIVIIVGAARRRKRTTPQPNWVGSGPEKGWYSAPDVPGKQRYWDGQAWTQYLR